MEERKWEDMNPDCLVNIFGRLGLESRVLVIPLVCKPWYLAVRNPLCWEQLIFSQYTFGNRSQTELIKFVVNQSQRCATTLALPHICDREELIYVSEECPALKMLLLPRRVCIEHSDIIPSLIVKWKNLKFLGLGYSTCIEKILELVRLHLPKFTGLCVTGGDDETASAIVSLVPKLECLIMNHARLQKENLLLILQGCKELELLDVRNCIGFDEDDEEILKLSSGIKKFCCDGSKAKYPFDFFDMSDISNDMSAISNAIANMQFDMNIIDGTEGDDFEGDDYFYYL